MVGVLKPWDPSKLSLSVCLPNHTSAWDEDPKHLFLEYYLLTDRPPTVPAHMNIAQQRVPCVSLINVTRSVEAKEIKPFIHQGWNMLCMPAVMHFHICLYRHFHECC